MGGDIVHSSYRNTKGFFFFYVFPPASPSQAASLTCAHHGMLRTTAQLAREEIVCVCVCVCAVKTTNECREVHFVVHMEI